MVVIAIDNASESLRGMLSRWLIEVKPGVFVGNLSKRVRSYIWEEIIGSGMGPQAVMIYEYPSEQGFLIESYGDPDRHLCEFDGLQLIGNYVDRKSVLHKLITEE